MRVRSGMNGKLIVSAQPDSAAVARLLS
jgi:hypothetical protein